MMSNFLSYITEASLALTALYAGYYFILRHKAAPNFNRFYLLTSLLLALGLPFIHIPLTTADAGAAPVLWEPASQAWNYLPELVIYGNGQSVEAATTETAVPWLFMVSCLYLTGMLISLLLTCLRLLRLIKLINRYPFRYSGDYSYQLASTNGEHPTFSFLQYIFWDDTAGLSLEEEAQVLRHEIAHVKKHHSLDLLFMELLTALLWFHPFVYLFRHSLSQVHEFQADRYALQQSEPNSYLRLMVKQTFRQANLPLVSTFFQHNTLTRIRMIQSKPTHPFLRASFSILLAGSIFFIAACEDEADKLADEPQLMELSAEEHMAVESNFVVERIQSKDELSARKQNNDRSITVETGDVIYLLTQFKDEQTLNKAAEIVKATTGLGLKGNKFEAELFNRLLKISGETLTVKYSNEEMHISTDGPSFSATEEFPETLDIPEPVETQSGDDQVFEVVEEQPEPLGGMQAFYEYVGQNLRYPEQARAAGIEGRVFIQFIVDEQGDVSDVQAVKGIGAGCDQEAVEIIRNSKWEPGKQKGRPVKVRMIMPVMFKLAE